jgi:hypothetical protein
MRAVLAFFAASIGLLLAGSFAGSATAEAPTLDVHSSGKSAVASFQPTSGTHVTVVAADLASEAGEPRRYLAGVAMDEEPRCSPDCLIPALHLLDASAEFDSPQLHGGVNGAKLDVTLPVTYCVLASCPSTIQVSLVWEPDGQPIRDTRSTRTDNDSCHFTRVSRFAFSHATPTGFVGYSSTNLASGEASGSVLEQSTRIVGSGDPSVCL